MGETKTTGAGSDGPSSFLNVPRTTNLNGADRPSLNVPNPASGSATGNPRNKVALKPGRSLMDWVKLTNASKSLAGVDRLMNVTPEELAKHSSQDDAWVCLRGQVYNVTPYMEYHPGGFDELMRGAGKDCTDLFDEVHRWVNYESMLKKCLVGKFKPAAAAGNGSERVDPSAETPRDSISPTGGKGKRPAPNAFLVPPPPPGATLAGSKQKGPHSVSFDWHESPGTLEICIFTRVPGNRVTRSHVVVDNEGEKLRVFVATPCENPSPSARKSRTWHRLEVKLKSSVENKMNLNVSQASGKVTLFFRKIVRERWGGLGESELESPCESAGPDEFYRRATLERVTQVTPNMKLFDFKLPAGCFLAPPLGHHVYLKTEVLGMGVVKAYTPVVPYVGSMDTDARNLNGSTLSLMVKIYPDGLLTPTLDKLKKGESVEISNPDGSFEPERFWDASRVAFIAAGSGITPMIRLLAELFAGRDDMEKKKSWIGLLLCNRTDEDIPWPDQWDPWKTKYPNFHVQHLLSRPNRDTTYVKGRVSKDALRLFLPQNVDEPIYVCLCGSSAFNQDVKKLLDALGNCRAFIFDG